MDQEKIRSLHSRYNPRAEADRYINSLSLNDRIRYGKIRFFILIEPGLGYIIAPLKKTAPNAKIISLHAGKLPMDKSAVLLAEKPASPDSEWYPEMGISIQEFLEKEIPDSEAAEIKMLE